MLKNPSAPHIDSMIRVNQAGEYGATRIYAGQLYVLGKTEAGPTLQEMARQEDHHLAVFNQMAVERDVRPTLLQPLWYVGGYALGFLTALMGEKAAHACTIAVEEVIEDHYTEQLKSLEGSHENFLISAIEQFRQDEIDHKNHAIAAGGYEAPAYPLLSSTIKAISKAAIWLSSRI
jgi:ubiquinone biosynthesis monooxygenase Coq7